MWELCYNTGEIPFLSQWWLSPMSEKRTKITQQHNSDILRFKTKPSEYQGQEILMIKMSLTDIKYPI